MDQIHSVEGRIEENEAKLKEIENKRRIEREMEIVEQRLQEVQSSNSFIERVQRALLG